MSKIINFLRESKVNKFANVMSNEDLIKELLSKSTDPDNIEIAKNKTSIQAIADVFQSITTDAMTINELMTLVYNKYDDTTLLQLASFITIIHGAGDNFMGEGEVNQTVAGKTSAVNRKWSSSHFSLPKKVPTLIRGRYDHGDTYGLLGANHISRLKAHPNKLKDEVYTIEEICHAKAEEIKNNENASSIPSQHNLVNATGGDSSSPRIAASKTKPSLAYILMDTPELRIGTRNNLELATFFNLLSTVELSKCQPYLNAVFILPSLIKTKSSSKVHKTASITQFFDGTPSSAETITDNYRSLEANFKVDRSTGKREKTKQIDAVETNMSAFTMPQTINNFNEIFVGHNENVKLNTDMNFTRATSVHDITRPFLTIKSFNIDVAPTQGLMSFKTGKLSLILHDRTRMVDIAPFVKPDLFGSFGAEIAIEYGWSHIDSNLRSDNIKNIKNYLGEFLENSRVTEKYIITNSSFNMDNTGQINIDLSIAMRGPVDIRSVKLHNDPIKRMQNSSIGTSGNAFSQAVRFINQKQTFMGTEWIDTEKKINYTNDDGTQASKSLSYTVRPVNIIESINSIVSKQISGVDQTAKGLKASDTVIVKQLSKNYNTAKRLINKINFPKDIVAIFKILDPRKKKSNKKNAPYVYLSGGIEPIIQLRYGNKAIDNYLTAKNLQSKTPGINVTLFGDGLAVGLKEQDIDIIKENLKKLGEYLNKVDKEVLAPKRKALAREKKLIGKLMGGLDEIDPFYNTHWLKEYYRIIKEDKLTNIGVKIQGIGTPKGPTSYVSFGSFITGLIGTHLSCTGKFDEIQVVSYTCNENCGLMSSLNVSSILLNKLELRQFLASLFDDNTTFTLEGVISQVINRFISTRTNICYGLSDLYNRDPNTGNVKAKFNSKMQKKKIDDRLRRIYYLSANPNVSPDTLSSNISLDDVRFVMPKVKFTFDTLTSRKSGYDVTISRISIFDQNDNPFGSVNTIMKDVYDKGIITVAAQLNKTRQEYKSKATVTTTKRVRDKKVPFMDDPTDEGRGERVLKYGASLWEPDESEFKPGEKKPTKAPTKWTYKTVKTKKLKISKEKFYKKSWSHIQKLIDDGKLIEISPGIYEINDQFKLDTLKNSFKNIMPSLTYGTQNSAIIEASVSTVNEAKLNTVYLTRSERAGDEKNKIAAKVSFSKDLPLRVLPSQATVTLFGCPFVNFAQYIFLDFETGTTVDNSYAITGIKHDLTPGKFTTQLTLSYGDVYGKYENAAKTIARTVNDIVKPVVIESAENDSNSIVINAWGRKPEKIEIGSRFIGIAHKSFEIKIPNVKAKNDESQQKLFTLNYNIKVIPTFTQAVWFVNKEKTNNSLAKDIFIAINSKIGDAESTIPNALNKKIEVNIDLLKNSKKHHDILKFKVNDPNNIKGSKNKISISGVLKKGLENDDSGSIIRNVDPVKNIKINNVTLFKDIKNKHIDTFVKSTKNFLDEAIKHPSKLTLKFNLEFGYEGIGKDYGPTSNIEGWNGGLKPKIVLDWDYSNPVKNFEFFKKHFYSKEIEKLILSEEYINLVKGFVYKKDKTKFKQYISKFNNVTHDNYKYGSFYNNNNKKKSTHQKKNNKQLFQYVKNNKIELTMAGIEFEIISGIEKLQQDKGNSISASFVFTKIIISYRVLFNNICDIKKTIKIT
jgi:hypothetical protein